MKSVVKAVVLGIILVGPSMSVALPPTAALGSKRCLCTCASALGSKVLEWRKNDTCNSAGKKCEYTYNRGRSWTPGRLENCSDCTYGQAGWDCKPAAGIALMSPVPAVAVATSESPAPTATAKAP